MKRAGSTLDRNVSPPPMKRKIESTTTNKAVASFFQPASQKEPEQITWRTVNQNLVIGKHAPSTCPAKVLQKPLKVAAFDLDDTLITPAGTIRWARSEASWRWWNTCVPGRLRELNDQGYLVVILSNQGTISLKDDPKKLRKDTASLANFKSQITSIFRQLDLPMSIYAATGQDIYRKPRVGMWEQMKEDYDLDGPGWLDQKASFYVGDAAGRPKIESRRADHASSDRDLAANIGINFKTPEEFFLGAEPEPYLHKFEPAQFLAQTVAPSAAAVPYVKLNDQDIVLFCGSPGAGKSSFHWTKLQPLGYERVNQDILKTRERCIKKAREYLQTGRSVTVDNTNRDADTRAHWIKLAAEFKIPIRCVLFTAPARLCEHNAAVRAFGKDVNPENRVFLPPIAIIDFARRFTEPNIEEGFQDITKVDFEFAGTDEEREQWSRYWVSKFST